MLPIANDASESDAKTIASARHQSVTDFHLRANSKFSDLQADSARQIAT